MRLDTQFTKVLKKAFCRDSNRYTYIFNDSPPSVIQ